MIASCVHDPLPWHDTRAVRHRLPAWQRGMGEVYVERSTSNNRGSHTSFKREKISGLLVLFLWNGLATIHDVGSKR